VNTVRLLAALALLMTTTQSAAKPPAWKNYTNVRFAFRVCYPNWLRPGRVSDNGDGRVFTDNSGVELRVWGSYGTLVLINGLEAESDEAPPATVLSQAADYEAKSLSDVAYRTVRHNWYVLSGTSKGKVVYLKTLAADDRWISLRLVYPAAAARKWNPLVGRMGACLKALPATQ
jgi:hypothetical protein